MTELSAVPLPAAPYIVVNADGSAGLSFQCCAACGTCFLEAERLACARCGARDFVAKPVGNAGTLHSFSIVHRGFPGVPVPFVSAVVDLDDGPSMKGNLRAAGFDPAAIKLGMRVQVVFDDALGRQDAAGNHYVSHFFEPAATVATAA